MKRTPAVFSFRGFLIVFWLMAVAGAYYIFHKPVGPALAANLLLSAGRVLAGLALLSTAGALGRRLFPFLALRPAARFAIHAALGLGVLSILWLLAGSSLGFSPLNAWVLLLALAAALRRELPGWWRDAAGIARIFRARESFSRLTALLLLFGLLAIAFTAAAPPLKFDALVYHLALPQAYLDAGRFIYVQDNVFWGMPQLGEMLYTWVIALTGSLEAAALFGWLSGLLTLAGLLGYMAQRFGLRASWAAAGVLLSGATLLRGLAWAYVDVFAMLYGLCIVVLLDLRASGRQVERHSLAGLAGIMAGFALSAKYTAGVGLLAGLAVIFAGRTPGDTTGSRKERLADALRFGSMAVLAFSPWLLKNFVATLNPLYPFGYPAGEMDARRLALNALQPPLGGWENAVLLPWQAVVNGVESAPGFSASIGPLLLAFGLLAGLGWSRRTDVQQQALRRAAVFSATGLLVWAVAGRLSGLLIQSRLYFVLFPAFAVLAGAGFQALEGFRWPGVRLGRIGAVLLAIVLGLNVLATAVDVSASGAARLMAGLESREDYLERNLGMFHLAMLAVQDLPPQGRVLMLFEPRSLECTPRCDPDEFLDRWQGDANTHRHIPPDIVAAWRAGGYTHLLYYRPGAEYFRRDPRFPSGDWLALGAVISSLPAVTNLDSVYILFEIP